MVPEKLNKENIVPVKGVVAEIKPTPNPYTKKVYDNLFDAYGQEHLPTYEIFSQKISDPKYRYAVRENLLDAYGPGNVPDFKAFNDSLDVVIPEKKNLGETGGIVSPLTGSELSSTPSNQILNNGIDKTKDPFSLLDETRNNFDFTRNKQVEDVVTSLGIPRSLTSAYRQLGNKYFDPNADPNNPESGPGFYSDRNQLLADYKSNPSDVTKKMNVNVWKDYLLSNSANINDYWKNIEPSGDKDVNQQGYYKEIEDISRIINNIYSGQQSANGVKGDARALVNLQNDVEKASDYINNYVREPGDKEKSLIALGNSSIDLFGSNDELNEYEEMPLGKYLNSYQSIGLNYLRRLDRGKAEFFEKYKDIDPSKYGTFGSFNKVGYEKQAKQLDELGAGIHLNFAQNQLNELDNRYKQQGNYLDPEDVVKYKEILDSANKAQEYLSRLADIYPDVIDANSRQIAQDYLGYNSGVWGTVGTKLGYGFAGTAQSVYDLAAAPFRSDEEIDDAALFASGFGDYTAVQTMNRADIRSDKTGQFLPNKELLGKMEAIKNSNLEPALKAQNISNLIQNNRDKYTFIPPDGGYNWGAKMIFASTLNFAADLAPFILQAYLTRGVGGSSIAGKFSNMFGNVLVTSYEQELGRAISENKPNPEASALGSIFVNALAYEAAGVGTKSVGYIRSLAGKMGGMTEKVISKLDDATITKMLQNPPSKLKGFMTDLSKTALKQAGEGAKNAAIFEFVMAGKEGFDVDFKQSALNALNFALFSTVSGTVSEVGSLSSKNKNNLYQAALDKDNVLFDVKKALADGKISQQKHNEIIKNVEAASKVLERVPMVDENGNKLSDKNSSELLYLKIKDQFIKDKINQDIPEKLKEKYKKEQSDNQQKIDKIYKGSLPQNIGKPFAGFAEGKMGEVPVTEAADASVPVQEAGKAPVTEVVATETPVSATEKVETITPVTPEKPVTEPVQEGVKPTDIEAKKADIERRKQEDLSKLPNNGIIEGDLITVKSNEADAIDAKYATELKALESGKAEVKPTEEEVFSETDKKGRTNTYFSNTTESNGLTKTNFTFSRTDKNANERFIATKGVPIEKALGDKYSINEKDIPEGSKVVRVSEVRVDKDGNAVATVTFESNGEKYTGEVRLNENKITEEIPEVTVKETIPVDLEERGQPIESTLEAERRRSNGERIFAVTEQDEMPVEVTSLEMLRNYTPDQLMAYKPIEEVKPTAEAKVASDLVSVSVAPYYDTQIKDISDASELRKSEGYKGHIQMLKKVAKSMGLEINSIDDTVGGFENKQGNKITEISNRVKLNTKDIDAAEKYAAVVGALAYETQEATIAARYVEHGDSKQSAIETELKVSDLNNAVKSLKEAGINSFEINENDNSIKILDFDNGKSKDFNDKMLSFADILDKNNVKYETEHHAIESRYVSPERRAELLKEAKLQAEQQKGGAKLRDIYEKSEAKSKEFLDKKELPIEIPEEVYNPIVDKIRKGIQKLSDKAKISVLKGKNFTKALNDAIKTGGANLQSWGGFEKKGFEESPEWKKLIDDGTVKLKFDLKGLEGKTVVVINPDNMLTGEVVTKDGKPIVDGNGGINFVTKYGDVWASSDKSTANTLARYINEARQKDLAAGGDGTVHVVVTKGDLSKSLTSHTGAKAAMKVLEHLVDKKLVSVSDFRKALTEVGKKYNIDFDGRLDSKSIHDDIAKKFFGVNDSTFSKRGFFIQDVIDHLSKNSKSAKENISKIREMLNTEALPKSTERKTGEISFAKEGIIDAIGHLLSDNITVGVKNSEAYATIEIKHPVEVFNLNKEEGGHESYPFHLRQIDKNGNKVKPVLNVLNESQHVTDVLNDVNNRPVDKKGGAGKFGSNQIGMARGVVKPASEHPSGVNMMTDATGKIYGFEKNGKIVLNADLMNGNTPFHEAGHLWLNWARESRADLHKAGMTKIEGSKYLQDVKNNPVYQENAAKLPELERDAYFKSEALAKAIGDNGEQFVNSAKKADFKQWLKDLWTSIADQFGLKDMTAEQISDLTLDEFSKKIVSDIVGKEKGMEKGLETEGVIEPAKMERKYEEIYKDLTNIEKRQIINSKFEKLLEELKIEKICPTD